MNSDETTPQNIDAYIAEFPPDIREILQKIRATIHEAAPQAVEKISYGMPAFYLKGNLVYFAAFKNHIGLYPAPSGIENFRKELAIYKSGKGSLRFPLDQPIPYELIAKITRFRVEENLAKAQAKNKKKK